MRPVQSTATCIFLVSLPIRRNIVTSAMFLGIHHKKQSYVTLYHWMYSVISQPFDILMTGSKASTPAQEQNDA